MKPREMSLSMKRPWLWVGAGVVALAGGFVLLSQLFSSGETHSAQERVRRILDGMKPGGDYETAISLWKNGSFRLPGGQEQFNEAADEFSEWSRRKEIGRISQYELTEARIETKGDRLGAASVIVAARIDGRPLRMRVVQGRPIEWVD